jgi:hypothetical protein
MKNRKHPFSKGKTATRVEVTDTAVKIFYHSTAIVEIRDGSVILNNGGWTTRTTKLRMNQAAEFFGIDFHVFQKKSTWYTRVADDVIPFDGHSASIENTQRRAA